MGKLRLDIKSTDVSGTYSITNLVFNGTNLVTSKQLSATVESLEYDVDILTSSNNVLKVSLLNPQANDVDNDGNFNGPEDQTLKAIITSLSYSSDNVNFTTLLPQSATSYTVPSGAVAGQVIELSENVSEFISYGPDYELTFNSNGIVTTEYCSGIKAKILPNGFVQDLIGNQLFDTDGNVV